MTAASDADRAKAAEPTAIEQMLAEMRAAIAANPPQPPTPDEAVASLRALTTCRCAPAWTERGRHETDCCSDWREEVDVLAAALAAERAAAVERITADLLGLAEELPEMADSHSECGPDHRPCLDQLAEDVGRRLLAVVADTDLHDRAVALTAREEAGR